MGIIKNVEPVKFHPFTKEPVSSNTLVYVYKNAQGKYRIVQDANSFRSLNCGPKGTLCGIRCQRRQSNISMSVNTIPEILASVSTSSCR